MTMTTDAVRAAVERASRVLLAAAEPPGALREAAQDLFTVLSAFAEIPEEMGTGTRLPQGEAISPSNAARCVTDYQRTAMFARGTLDALRALARRFQGERLRVLYAGSGPFAPLMILPLVAWRDAPASFTLIDVHPESLSSARRLIEVLGLDSRLDACVSCDATTYVPPAPVHLLITETMQAGLRKEPQVAVTAHLAQWIDPNGLLIPERVTVEAAILEFPSDATWSIRPLATLAELSRHRCAVAEPVRVTVPRVERSAELVLRTSIDVFGPHALGDRESGLTMPLLQHRLSPDDPPMIVEFTYRSGPNPEFQWTRLDGRANPRGGRLGD